MNAAHSHKPLSSKDDLKKKYLEEHPFCKGGVLVWCDLEDHPFSEASILPSSRYYIHPFLETILELNLYSAATTFAWSSAFILHKSLTISTGLDFSLLQKVHVMNNFIAKKDVKEHQHSRLLGNTSMTR